MISRHSRRIVSLLWLLAVAPVAGAAGVSVRAGTSVPTGTIFPSDQYTVADTSNLTALRVALPKPDCTVQVSECQDIDVINTLDGFSMQPRITVPFTGAIDPDSVTSTTVYLTNMGDTVTHAGAGQRVGINQVLWDPTTLTLVVESDALLQPHSRYMFSVTNGVHDARGRPIVSADRDDLNGPATGSGSGLDRYHRDLRDAQSRSNPGRLKVVASSLFTTQSVSEDMEKINATIKLTPATGVNFMIGSSGGTTVRTVFPVSALQSVQFTREVNTAPSFKVDALPLASLAMVPGAVGQLAYGQFRSQTYLTPQTYFPPTGTATAGPTVQGENVLLFQLFLPAGAKPANGWPVALMGHGFGDNMYGAPWQVASVFASQGLATLSINVVGHGYGALGTLGIQRSGGDPVTLYAGGRGVDQDGNGTIDSSEGVNAMPPRLIIASRDGLRQTVIDLMHLIHEVQAGIDVDGDGIADLDGQRIYYAGQSFGGIYGTMLLATEQQVRAGVPNVAGGSLTDVGRLGSLRWITTRALAARQPSLINLPPIPGLPPPLNEQFNENIPLRDLPPLVNNVPGALDIAYSLDQSQWVQQAANPVAYAAYIRTQPLSGHTAKPVIYQFAKGDETMANPTTTAILRAGNLSDRTTYFRNDLAYALDPGVGTDPHSFLLAIDSTSTVGYAIAAQQQIAAFFVSDGLTTLDPDGSGPMFEVPIVGPLPETLNFLP